MTPELLQAAVVGCTAERAARWAAPITAAMQSYDITSAYRQAAFLAQVGHESGGLLYVRELWGPTPAQTRYEGRADLGNTQPGDGFRFRGRGLLQVTGRLNYAAVGKALGVDLIAKPELLEQPALAARSAAHFWRAVGCNELADIEAFRQITLRINGGTNGLEDRIKRWAVARSALGIQRQGA